MKLVLLSLLTLSINIILAQNFILIESNKMGNIYLNNGELPEFGSVKLLEVEGLLSYIWIKDKEGAIIFSGTLERTPEEDEMGWENINRGFRFTLTRKANCPSFLWSEGLGFKVEPNSFIQSIFRIKHESTIDDYGHESLNFIKFDLYKKNILDFSFRIEGSNSKLDYFKEIYNCQ